MTLVSAKNTAGNDNPICRADEDRYGFTDLAEKLSNSIISLDRNISTVIGIEGKWGAGKTSLLNLLMETMIARVPKGTHVLKIAPWLTPSGKSTIESLLLPVAAILDDEEVKKYTGFRKFRHRFRQAKVSPLARNMLRYAQHASGQLAPLAELAGNWVPGAGIAASALKTVSTADLSARRQTTDDLRREIETRIYELKLNFIVVLDDLDRLEPDQAVEVLRLIRSVADFTGFHYVMCYDPAVLGHAVERGLGVLDGRLYLQKIVPVSFNLPLPESFDLRREFLSGSLELFSKINGTAPEYALYQDLKSVVSHFGATLTTPREVRMALGSLAFRYQTLREHIWFPDLCLLQLLRVTHPGLYSWVENYLTEYATVASGNGSISDKELESMKKGLKDQLEQLPAVSSISVMELSRWLPGIEGVDEDTLRLFVKRSEQDKTESDSVKRLTSSFYWRFYFAFTPPKDVLPPQFFDRLFLLADNDDQGEALTNLLFSKMVDSDFSSRTWFEQIIERLNPAMLERATPSQCQGLLHFIFRNGDKISTLYRKRVSWLHISELGLMELADRLIRRLYIAKKDEILNYLKNALQSRETFTSGISYLRHMLWQNGLSGNRPALPQEQILHDDELRALCLTAAAWLSNPDNKDVILALPELGELVYAWREISSPEEVAKWLRSVTNDDESFLRMILRLRYHGIRSDIGRYKGLRLNEMDQIFNRNDYVSQRLDHIESSGKFCELTSQIRKAITLGGDK
ncbi:TPA: P-loop NTPase fold protein [Enterobacter cloacae]